MRILRTNKYIQFLFLVSAFSICSPASAAPIKISAGSCGLALAGSESTAQFSVSKDSDALVTKIFSALGKEMPTPAKNPFTQNSPNMVELARSGVKAELSSPALTFSPGGQIQDAGAMEFLNFDTNTGLLHHSSGATYDVGQELERNGDIVSIDMNENKVVIGWSKYVFSVWDLYSDKEPGVGFAGPAIIRDLILYEGFHPGLMLENDDAMGSDLNSSYWQNFIFAHMAKVERVDNQTIEGDQTFQIAPPSRDPELAVTENAEVVADMRAGLEQSLDANVEYRVLKAGDGAVFLVNPETPQVIRISKVFEYMQIGPSADQPAIANELLPGSELIDAVAKDGVLYLVYGHPTDQDLLQLMVVDQVKPFNADGSKFVISPILVARDAIYGSNVVQFGGQE